MKLSVQKCDEVRPDYAPAHGPRNFYFRIVTIGLGPIRIGGSASALIGWEAYVRIGWFSLRWSIPA